MKRVAATAWFIVCASTVPAAGQTAADTASVQAFYREWFGSIAQGPERYASFYAENGMVLPPGLPAAVGRPAIARWLQESQAGSPFTVRPEGITVDEIRFLSAEWVVYRTTLRGQRTPKSGGASTPFETKYVDLLNRTPAGGWQVAYRIWSDSR
jgi:ketosteroid isomerase-like protein